MAKKKTHLAPADLYRLQLAQAALDAARARHGQAKAECALANRNAECQTLQAQAQQLIAQASTRARAEQADQLLRAAEDEHRNMAEEVGRRYAVDWKATAFDTDTGLFMPLGD